MPRPAPVPFALLAAALTAASGAAAKPELPREFAAVIRMTMSYIPLEMPLRVLTSSAGQRVEYHDGLEVDTLGPQGTYKYVFNNSRRVCLFSPPSPGPASRGARGVPPIDAWTPLQFFPDLSGYTQVADELVGGVMCQKFVLSTPHGSAGNMDDHMAFFWDPVLQKPVRWHMHSRHATFGSHTDEYIMDFIDFQAAAPAAADLQPPSDCAHPVEADGLTVPLRGALTSALEILAGAAAGGPAGADAESRLPSFGFAAHLRQYGKSYGPEEHARRRALYARNTRLVQELNVRHAGRASFRVNQFADMTPEEVLQLRGGKATGATRAERRSPEHMQFVREHRLGAGARDALPAAFDWRTAAPGAVGPVKDQGMCGSCWTYGLTEPVESRYAIATGRLVELPEQFVVDCTWTSGRGGRGANSGCDGGNSDSGALEIVRKFGGVIPTAAAYGSYLSVDGYCKDTRLMEVGAKLTGWVDIASRHEAALLHALVSEGPVSIGIMVPLEMLFYDGGVLSVPSCQHDEQQIVHAVVLVGFGRDAHGTDYYTVRNSWSTYWGDQGYIRIARGGQDCCVSCEAGYPQVEVVSGARRVLV